MKKNLDIGIDQSLAVAALTVVTVVLPFTGMAQDARGDRDDQNEGLLEGDTEEILPGYDKQINMFGQARKLHEAARDGDHMTLFTILADLPVPLRVIVI